MPCALVLRALHPRRVPEPSKCQWPRGTGKGKSRLAVDPEYQRLLAILGQPDSAVRAAFRVGSRVYGTAGPGSDHDYLVVMADPAQKQDLLFGEQINIVLHGAKTFQAALDEPSVFAFEGLFTPPEHCLKAPRPPFSFKLDKKRLAESAISRSTSDYEKARKRFGDEPGPSRKKLFHSLRVPLFARQLARTGKITNFAEANDHYIEIATHPSEDFADYEPTYGPLRASLCAELLALARF